MYRKKQSFSEGISLFGLMMFAILLIIVALTVASCGTTKKAFEKSTVIYDSTVSVELRDSLSVLQKSYERLQQEYNESQYNTVTFDTSSAALVAEISDLKKMVANCDPDAIARLNSIIAGLESRVKLNADGSIEASGRLRSANADYRKLLKTNVEISRENDSLRTQLAKKETGVRTVTETVTKTKKVTRFPWWWWLFVAVFVISLAWHGRKHFVKH